MNIKKLIPFLDEEDLNELADKILESEEGSFDGVKIGDILSFLEDEKVDEIFLRQVKEHKDYQAYLPFVSDECMDRLTEDYINGEIGDFDIESVFPYMEDDNIKKVFRAYLKKKTSARQG